jgi:RNA-dependent RNA polymerase
MILFRFTTVLDSRKTGLVIKSQIMEDDSRKFGSNKPACLGGSEFHAPPKRNPGLGPFILEELLAAGNRIQEAQLKHYGDLGTHLNDKTLDPDLLQPWREIERVMNGGGLSPVITAELYKLRDHVKEIQEDWIQIWQNENSSYNSRERSQHIKKWQQDRLLDLARKYEQNPPECQTLCLLGNVDKLKASCTYSLAPRLARNVAFQALCKIKAETQRSTAFTREFAEAMSMSSAEVRVRSQFNTQMDTDYNTL